MIRSLPFIFRFILLFNISIFSQVNQSIQKIIDLGKTDNKTMQIQDILCNRFGGRPIGSDAYTNSANWVLSQFKNWGLRAELDYVGELPIGFNRGAWFGKTIKPKEMYLEFGTPSFTAGTKGVQRGHVVIMPSSDAKFDSIKSKMKDAWVLIDGVNEGWPRDRDSISTLTKKLIATGALGTIQLSKIPMRLLDSRCVNSWDNLPTLPDIKLLDIQFNEIKSLVERGEEVILQFDIRNFFNPGPIKYHNIIGIIPGTEFQDEYVVLGAHLDSYDSATGAIDNASGVSPMMEAIRLIKESGAKPKRSIMIQIYAGEERGLLGSSLWVKRNTEKLSKISVMLNKDFGTNPITGINVPKAMIEDFKKIVEPIATANLKYPIKLSESGMFRKAGRGGTDSHSFLMAGVPTPYISSEGPHQYGKTWHTPADTYNEIIPDALEDASIKIALLALGAANLDHLLPRDGAFLPDGIYADMNTNKGGITVALDYEHTPLTVSNFIGLAEGTIKNKALPEGKPYFNGSIWHRVVPEFVIQAGMPAVKDTLEGPGYEFPNEIFPGLSHNKAGILGMANAGPHTNGSQFYITLSDYPHLDGRYTVFGSVVDGMDVVNKIVQGDTIRSVTIIRIGEQANNFKVVDESFRKMVGEANLKIKLDNEKRISDEVEAVKTSMPNTAETVSGIKYIIEKEGTGNKPQNESVLIVKYKGKFLLEAKEFASTKHDGKPDLIESPETFEYIVGKTKINHALDEILLDMKKGEKRRVIALSKNAYGENVVLGKRSDEKKYVVIPPNSSLVYEIEVLQIK